MKKTFKGAFVLMLALLTVFASACTAVSGEGLSSTEQSLEASVAEEQSLDAQPAAFDDGVFYGLHILGNPPTDDIFIASSTSVSPDGKCGYDTNGESFAGDNSQIYDYTGDRSPLNDFFDANSFTTRSIVEKWGESAAKDFMTGITEEDLAAADFDFLRASDFLGTENLNEYFKQFEEDPAANVSDVAIETVDYDEAAASGLPIHFMLETVPRNGVIDGIMDEYSVDMAKAIAIYRQKLIDLLCERGFYADSFFDWYSYDTLRAYGRIVEYSHRHGAYCSPREFLYDDSVYAECAHLIFSVYAKATDIEALEGFLNDGEDAFFKARGLSSSYCADCYSPSHSLSAIKLEERSKTEFYDNYINRRGNELERAAISAAGLCEYKAELCWEPYLYYPYPYDVSSEPEREYEENELLVDFSKD